MLLCDRMHKEATRGRRFAEVGKVVRDRKECVFHAVNGDGNPFSSGGLMSPQPSLFSKAHC